MGYSIEINCLLKIPANSGINLDKIKVGDKYTFEKQGERLYPLNIAIEICSDKYIYYGKVAIRKLTLQKGKTILEIEILKVFNEQESQIFSNNFIKSNEV